jgi:heat shock protein HslJ
VPKNFLVWATGDLQNPDEVLQPDAAQRLLASRTSDEIITVASPADLQQGLITAQTDTVTWRWQAENVPDVAIGLSDHYVWDAGSVVAAPGSERRVSVHAAYAEEFTDFARMAQEVKEIVASVSSNWPGVPWPYSHAIVFVGGGDEEFPMMANDGPEAPEGVSVRLIAAHELLHNYFPFYMGIDERRYPFMDEGWTTAFEYLFNLEDIGKEAADAVFIAARSSHLVNAYPGEEIPIIVPADATRGLVTGKDGYEKPALAYLALKEYMGDEAFKTSLHAFIERWHGKRPLPWDMFNTFNDMSDLELNWFFQNWFFESYYLDIALGDVQAVDGGYAILVENVGGTAIPFDVKVVYADDSAASFRQGPGVWQDSPDAVTVMIPTDQEVKSVTLDGGIFVDATVNNNTWSSEAAAETEAATAVPAPSPTDELAQLRATPWQWVAFTSPVEQFAVEAPLSYLVQFNDDATVNIVADCNNAVGDYQGEGGTLEIQIGPMTAAACPPDSRSDQFVRLLGGAALYFFADGNLHIDLFADGGTMVFSPAPPAVFGDDGEGAVAGLPATSVATLGNLSYSGLFDDQEITLAGGVYSATSDGETIVVHLLASFVALGDLNGDGREDAVALLELDTSGSGRFTFAAPVLDVLTTPTVGTAVEVGDRIQPNALSIADGQAVFEYVGHGAGDGDCCPSWNIHHTFAWQDGALVEVSRAEVSKVEN